MSDKAIRWRFIWLAFLLGVQTACLLALVIHVGFAMVFGFLVFAVCHDWGRVLDRSPRLVNLLRARAMARMFYATPAFVAARGLAGALDEPRHLLRARTDGYFKSDLSVLDDASLSNLGRAYAALAAGRDTAIVGLVLVILVAIQLPGFRGNHTTLLMATTYLFVMCLVVILVGSIGLGFLRGKHLDRGIAAAQVTSAVFLLFVPFHALLGIDAFLTLRKVKKMLTPPNA